ncbi:MAG TPA: protein phosphatase 2C domain-containing protein [Acidimicrobiales bacterium]|nr:protein phosphatase 2C domain-containing protein [Acidimicrobiales bacterium]
MSGGWAGPVWGEPSAATDAAVPLRTQASASQACYRADGGRSAEFVVLAASVAGVAHRLSGRRCEDAYAWALPRRGRLAVIVADGVSTAGRGGEGADIAVSSACEHLLAAESWGEIECLAALRAASEAVSGAGGRSAAELSTTLVVALVSTSGAGAEVSLARVGDSSAFVLAGAEWGELFPGRAEEEMRGNVVGVLPLGSRGDDGAIETASMALPAGAALVLLTDGVADPLRDGPGTVAPALAEVLSGGPSGALTPLALADAADFSRRGCQDDRTVLAAWPL